MKSLHDRRPLIYGAMGALVGAALTVAWFLLRAPDEQGQIARVVACANSKGIGITAQAIQQQADSKAASGGDADAEIRYWADLTGCRDAIR